MNLSEQKKFHEMEKNVETLLEVQHKNGEKLDQVLEALKGNSLSGDPGLVKRLETLEGHVRDLRIDRTKNSVYLSIIKWLAYIIGALIIAYMFNTVYNKPGQNADNISKPKLQLYGELKDTEPGELFYLNAI